MKIGSMNNPQKNIIQEIQRIKAQNFDYIDLTYEAPYSASVDAQKVIDALHLNSLEAIGHTDPGIPFIYPIEKVRQACLDDFENSLIFFDKLGITKITVHPFYYGRRDPTIQIDENIKVLKNIVEIAKKYDQKIMLENVATPFDRIETFEKILDQIPDLYVHLDIGHFNINANAISLVDAFFKKFGHKILHIHAHDNGGVRDEHLPIGCGTLSWPKIIQILKKYDYDQTITLEVFCIDPDYLLLSKKKLESLWKDT